MGIMDINIFKYISHRYILMKKHFIHPHPLKLRVSALQRDENGTEMIICSGCEQPLIPADDPFYMCSTRGCEFFLHKSCSDLPRNMKHKSHPGHELTLLSASGPPEYNCNACGDLINGFSFHCNKCHDFRLHVKCAFLAETLDSKAHEHILSVEYSSVLHKSGSGDDNVAICDVCGRFVKVWYWFFRCKECDFDTHLGCGISAEGPEEDLEGLSDEQRADIKAMDCMAKLQIQMKMADEVRSHIISVVWGDGSESSSSSSSDDD